MLEAVAKVEELDLPLKNNQSMVFGSGRDQKSTKLTVLPADREKLDGIPRQHHQPSFYR